MINEYYRPTQFLSLILKYTMPAKDLPRFLQRDQKSILQWHEYFRNIRYDQHLWLSEGTLKWIKTHSMKNMTLTKVSFPDTTYLQIIEV